MPSVDASQRPSTKPSTKPSIRPSTQPSIKPSRSPSTKPSVDPSSAPVAPTPTSGPTTGMLTVAQCFQRGDGDDYNVLCNTATGETRLYLWEMEPTERCGCCNNRYEWTPTCNALAWTAPSASVVSACCQRSPAIPLATPTPTPPPSGLGLNPTGSCPQKGSTSNYNVICQAWNGQTSISYWPPDPLNEACGCCNGRFESSTACNTLSQFALGAEVEAACCQRAVL